MIRLMIVDDLRYARLGYQLMIGRNEEFHIVAEASNGQEAIETIQYRAETHQSLPDVILMDVRMPTMDGIQATQGITSRWPSIKVIILTTWDEDDYAYGGLNAGASGFLLKDANVQTLLEAIRAVVRGDAVVTPRITRQILQRALPQRTADKHQHQLQQKFYTLPRRQREICALIADGLTNSEIAEQLVLEPASVRRTISRILSHLQLHDRTQIAVNWYKAGM